MPNTAEEYRESKRLARRYRWDIRKENVRKIYVTLSILWRNLKYG
jgi:hypothetical protein